MSGPGDHHVLVAFGTRPEAIKLAPVVLALDRDPVLRPVVAVTGQHRSMLDQVLDTFAIVPDHDLDIGRQGQSLASIASGALGGIDALIRSVGPDVVIVQGDTTSAFAAALAAFYAGVPVAHVEAGLRSGDRLVPYPEEVNRRLITQLAALHLAPTPAAAANLVAEGVDPARVFCTGNTVIDALHWTAARTPPGSLPAGVPPQEDGRRLVLVTVHRRESWGPTMTGIGRALAAVARAHPEVTVVVPVHKNPVVRTALVPVLEGLSNVVVIEPLTYPDLVRVLARAYLVVTDSGGIQEEAPSLGVPVLVLRDVTERPEAVAAGAAELVGTGEVHVAERIECLLSDPDLHARMATVRNPFGDGVAAQRCVAAVRWLLGAGPRPGDFPPAVIS